MKRIFILFGVLVFAIGTQAQMNQHSNYIGFNLGGGMNTLMYKTTDGDWSPRLGFLGELKYMHFFGEHFGMGIGFQFNMENSAATFNNHTEVQNGLTHPANNLTYNSTVGYNDWKERQSLPVLGVPIEFYWRAPMTDRWSFLAGLGVQLDFPMKGSFTAEDGRYSVSGYFPVTNVTYGDPNNPLPAYGFTTYNADEKGDIELKKFGLSVIADLGFNYALNDNWGLYLGIYGGYGLTNLIDEPSTKPMLSTPDATLTNITYNGVLNSVQVDEVHLLNVGLKLGVNFGWDCEGGNAAYGDSDNSSAKLVPYDNNEPASKQGKDKANADKKGNKDNGAKNNGTKDNGNANDVAPVSNANAYGNDFGNDNTEAEAAAEEARRNARLMNSEDLAAALKNIDDDIAQAEKDAMESGDPDALAAVEKAKAEANAAKEAYKKGQYGRAYDYFTDAYGDIADSYADDAKKYAKDNNVDEAKKAANDAALYAEAAHKCALDCAMASSRNARINAEIARDASNGNPHNPAPANKYEGKAPATGNNPAVGNNAPAGKGYPTSRENIQALLDMINATIHFQFAGTEPEFGEATDLAINTLCKAMAADKNVKVLVTGHTDNIGSAAGNMTYGRKRAEKVKALMVKRGAPASSISTTSRGEEEPVVDNDTDEHRYQNRRAVITLR